jgi:hypothetical protein
MPDIEDLHDADRQHSEAIAELRAKVQGHDEDIARHDRHLAKLDEAVAVLREGFARVATKEDIGELRKDISMTFYEQLKDAHNSVPGKFAAACGLGMLLIALVSLVLGIHHG